MQAMEEQHPQFVHTCLVLSYQYEEQCKDLQQSYMNRGKIVTVHILGLSDICCVLGGQIHLNNDWSLLGLLRVILIANVAL